MKKIFSFLTAILLASSMWADPIQFAKADFSKSGDAISATKDGVTVSCTNGNIPSSGSKNYVTFTKNSTLTISCTSGNITAIDFTTSDSGYTGNMTDVSDISTDSWSTTVECEGQKTTVRVSSISVTVETSTCETEVDITKGTPANGDFELSAESVCADGDGGTITVSNIEATTGFRFKTITTSASGDVDNTNKKVTGIKAATTINVEFEAIPSHKIHFNTNGVAEVADQTVLEGETFTITDAINEAVSDELGENCTYNTFVGWTLSSSIADASVKPELVTSVTMSTSDVTLYAVYSKTTGGGGSTDDSKTFTFSEIADENDWENGTAYTTVVIDPVTIVANGGGNNGKWYTSGGGSWRMYSGGTVKITVEGGEVTAVTSSPSCAFEIDNNGVATFSPSARTDFTEITVDYTISGGGTTTYSLDAQCAAAGTCVTPSISPATGTYSVAQEVTITTATDGATIYYTTDGTTPSSSNGTVYTEAISVSSNMTIKAIATKATYTDSEVATATYTFKCAAPTFEAEGVTMSNGQFKTSLTITLASTSAGAVIYYTVDGTDPTTSSELYDEPFDIDATTTVKAIAVKDGWANSDAASQAYVKFAVVDCATARIAALSVSEDNEYYNDGEEFTTRAYVTNMTKYAEKNYFWISDTKGTTQTIEVYLPSTAYAETLALDYYVEVTGKLTKYTSTYSTTPEFASGCTFQIISTPTAVDNVETSAKAVKVLKNGLLLIEKNGKTYNAQGQVVK